MGRFPVPPYYTADVVVKRVGEEAVAINSKGEQIAESTDHANVIQAAIDNLPNGGKVLIKSGKYVLKSGLSITDKNIVLEGERFGKYPFEEYGTILIKAFDGDLLTINYTDSDNAGFALRSLVLHGNKGSHTGRGLVISNAKYFTIEDVTVIRCDGECLYIEDSGVHRIVNSRFVESNNHVIHYVNTGDWGWMGIDAGSAGTDKYVAYLENSPGLVINSKFYVGYGGIFSTGTINIVNSWFNDFEWVGIVVAGANSIIIGNIIQNIINSAGAGDAAGIRIQANYVKAIGNDIRGGTSYNMRYGIYEYGGNDYSIIIGNTIRDYKIKAIYKAFANSIIISNQGYKTENHGTATVTGDGSTTSFTVDVEHGLVSDKIAAKVALDRAGSYKAYLVDTDNDGFKETLRIEVTYDTAPADGETCYIYWSAEVVG